jgi:Cof subfamily protein (haloacid dehalogenase superfamily)
MGWPLTSPIRLLAVDLDGTVLTKNRKPHPQNSEAFRRAREAGIVVVPASGRSLDSLRPYAEELGTGLAAICCNGAHVVGPEGEEVVHHGLDVSVLDMLLQYGEANNVHVHMYSRGELIFFSNSVWGDLYITRLTTMTPVWRSVADARTLPITKVMIVDDASNIPVHRDRIALLLDSRLVAITESEAEYLEFLHPLANKGNALRTLAGHLGVPQEQTAAIGDYLNDLEMIRWAGIGAAVANALTEVRECADVVVASNEEGGVASFIDSLLVNQRE